MLRVHDNHGTEKNSGLTGPASSVRSPPTADRTLYSSRFPFLLLIYSLVSKYNETHTKQGNQDRSISGSTCGGGKMTRRINPFNLINQQYNILRSKLNSTGDPEKRKILSKRLINLLAVLEFLISINNST